MKTAGTDLLPIDDGILWSPDASEATPGMFHDCDLPPQRRLDPLVEAFLLVSAVSPDQLETRKGPGEWRKQAFAAAVVLDVGLMNQDLQDQPIRIDQQVALAAFDFFPSIVATNPSLLCRLTD